jgi:hypothetical protein
MIFIEPQLTPEEYKDIVIETLGEYRPHVQHNIILAKNEDKNIGVFNYFPYGNDTMFLHYCWVKSNKLKCWQEFFEYVKPKFKHIIGVIDSRNKPALIWGLKTGFEITGMRLDINKNLIIEVIKEL